MSSRSKIDANRRNAKKSTGPRSVEGKAASSQNALKTGIAAKSLIIRGEKVSSLEALADSYHRRFQPATPEQSVFVDALIAADWLLRRLRAVEPQLWQREFEDAAVWSRTREGVPLGDAFYRSKNTFHNLQRRLDVTERSYYRALESLRKLRPDCFSDAPAKPLTPVPSPEIGFVLSSEPAPAIPSASSRTANTPASAKVPPA